MKSQTKSLANLILRGASLLLKFVFVVFIGKYSIDESNLGIYGIFNSSIGYTIYIVGFEYYVYVSRKITQEKTEIEYYLKHQLVFYSLTYLLLLPLIIFILFGFNFIEYSYILLFCVVLIAEHLGQEVFRLLSVLKKPLKANFVLLIRCLWIVLSIVHYLSFKEISIRTYFLFWSLSSLFGLLIGILLMKKYVDFKKLLYVNVNFYEIKKGVKVSLFFFISSLSIQTILLSGRFFLDFHYNKQIVGVYTFYSNIINLIEVVIYNLVIMIIFPYMLESAYSNKEKFKKIATNFRKKAYLLTFISSIIIALIMPLLLLFLDKSLATERLWGFYILLIGSLMYNFSLVHHYILYAFNKDKYILKAALFSVLVNLILNYFLVKEYELYGICISYFFSMLIILLCKGWFKKKTYVYENIDN
ncbi:lipopolysaccharide biosynthesis protein [Aquimarina intermedia]|uniref:lipopolysaccharide biosynthesis protein n=1 Tax=Aquimarina intermedia TaxID=350814 RepID=UPI0014798164|nr:polysaccharide biosynthesis C-terminal domain-containing protein [Aquimarina intermedia]